ncbi:MAG: hypothetical protein JW940_17790, partial [Polyangiaceae bacterium]|nr:hypothetical protein [Polyangiaceae bacterium]
LMITTQVVRAHWTSPAGHPFITEEELAEAETLVARFLTNIGQRDQAPLRTSEASLTRQRAFTLFVTTYAEARRAVQYLRFHEGDAESFVPSLYAGRGNGNHRRAEEDGEQEPEAEPAATPAEAAVEPSTVVAPAASAPAEAQPIPAPETGGPFMARGESVDGLTHAGGVRGRPLVGWRLASCPGCRKTTGRVRWAAQRIRQQGRRRTWPAGASGHQAVTALRAAALSAARSPKRLKHMGMDERRSAQRRARSSVWCGSGSARRLVTAAAAPGVMKLAALLRADASSSRLSTRVAPGPPAYGCAPIGNPREMRHCAWAHWARRFQAVVAGSRAAWSTSNQQCAARAPASVYGGMTKAVGIG